MRVCSMACHIFDCNYKNLRRIISPRYGKSYLGPKRENMCKSKSRQWVSVVKLCALCTETHTHYDGASDIWRKFVI
eukprot:TRINITY_DN6361_c0_g1_i1.p1 TRINITY_DN6361_c0_g1~~TRINITY_DN6361_c0_g1_i1.p1  ORF type:complete len:76 (+),score=3.46 TRINITY_DN6361_c0_g1_i1:130-357(+)